MTADFPSVWVQRFAPRIPFGEVLDLACGQGRHARLLAALGYPVIAVDHDSAALQKTAGENIQTLLLDLENGTGAAQFWANSQQRFTGIVVTCYLHRPLFPQLLNALAPGGMLIYETFAAGHGQFGRPSNPEFLLQSGELLQLAASASMRVLAYEDGFVEQPKPALIQRLCAIKAGSDWEPAALLL